MMDLTVKLDLSPLKSLIGRVDGLEAEVRAKVADLSAQTHLHIKEQVQSKLNTRRQMYDDALSKAVEVSAGVWVITLDKSAVWIEEGMPAHSMVDDLLRSGNVRTAADGSRYKVIPFNQGQGGTSVGAARGLLNQAVRQEMKKRNISYKSIERDASGTPKLGLLHKFSVAGPNRPVGTQGKPGWGKGAVGDIMQGPNSQGGSGGGIPFLQGVRIYQSLLPGQDKQGRSKVQRAIMTFRVVSSKHRGIKWNYPGIEGTNFFEEAERWAAEQWDRHILPDILRRIDADNPGGGP